MNDVQIIPESSNTFRIKNGEVELYVYCSDEYISIRAKGKIEYPEKDSVKFYPERK